MGKLLVLVMLLKVCEYEIVLDCMGERGEFPIGEKTLSIDANGRVMSRVTLSFVERSCYRE